MEANYKKEKVSSIVLWNKILSELVIISCYVIKIFELKFWDHSSAIISMKA